MPRTRSLASTGIPERFLLKILKPLASDGILFSTKGPNGGYRLRKPAKKISVNDVIQSIEGEDREAKMIEGMPRNKNPQMLAKLSQMVAAGTKASHAAMGRFSIADFVTRGGGTRTKPKTAGRAATRKTATPKAKMKAGTKGGKTRGRPPMKTKAKAKVGTRRGGR